MKAFTLKKVNAETEAAIKAAQVKRGPRSGGRTLEAMLRDFMESLAYDKSTVAIGDADGNPLVVCREITDNTIFGWDYDVLPEEVRDLITKRSSNGEGKTRKTHAGWKGVTTTLGTVAKELGMTPRIIPPSGESEDSAPLKAEVWEDTPTFGCLIFRPYTPRKRGEKPEADDSQE